MIILACETSTLLGSVAVLENDRVLACEESVRQGSHSDVLNVFIGKALKKAGKTLSDVDLFASGIGPGSFTGIRISVNTIKTLAYCFNKPVVGVNSLYNLATQIKTHNLFSQFENRQVVSMINAYKNMVYVSTFKVLKGVVVELRPPEVVRVQNLQEYLSEESIVCGDGYLAYEKYLPIEAKKNCLRLDGLSDEPHAITLGQLGFQMSAEHQKWPELLPLYLRASEAEENLKGIKYQPLF